MSKGQRAKKHSQRGQSMGTCPDCLKPLLRDQKTLSLPVMVAGRWRAVLVHLGCADADR